MAIHVHPCMIGIEYKARWLLLSCLFFWASHAAIACVSYDEWEGDVSSDWNNANNWEGNSFPGTTQAARIDPDNYTNAPVVSANSSFTPRYLVVQDNATMTIQANVQASRNTVVASGAEVTVSGGTWTINSGYDFEIEDNNTVVTVSGGTISVTDDIILSGGNSAGADPTLTITSGSITVGQDILFDNSANDEPTMNIDGGTVSVAGDVMRSGGAVNLSITAGTLNVSGDLDLPNASDEFTMSGGAINIGGDWTVNGASTVSGGTVTFNGTAGQTISNNSGQTFNNLVINNTSAAGVTLNDAVTVNNTLTLTDGIVNSSATDIVNIADNATVSGTSNASYVDGWVRKSGNEAFTFPVGADNRYRPISITAPPVAADEFSATYNFFSPNGLYMVANRAAALNHVSTREYWELQRDAGTSTVIVGLSWDDSSGSIGSLTDLRVARWNGSQWDDAGNGGTTGDTTSGTVITGFAMSGYGAFALSSASSNNVLPVTWLDFSAQGGEDHIRLEWTTATELMNDRFEVERSGDMLEFEKIGEVPSKAGNGGNSKKVLAYEFTDERPLPGYNYYRLRQVDLNSDYDLSKVIVERMNMQHAAWEVSGFVDVSSGSIRLKVPVEETAVDISLYNMMGMLVYAARQEANHGSLQVPLRSCFVPGFYLMNVQSASDPANTGIARVFVPGQ